MKNISELNEAQLRHEFRIMYKEIGFTSCLQVLYELVISANILLSIMLEEIENNQF